MARAADMLPCSNTDLHFGEMDYKIYECFISDHEDAVNTAHYVCQLLWFRHCTCQQNDGIYQY